MRFILSFLFVFALFQTFSSNASAAIAQAQFNYGVVVSYSNSAHNGNSIEQYADLNISNITLSPVTDDGRFGGTQGNDYDVTVTITFSDSTTQVLNSAINWRETNQGSTRGVGIIPDSGQGWDGKSFLLRLSTSNVTYNSTNDAKGNAANPSEAFAVLNQEATSQGTAGGITNYSISGTVTRGASNNGVSGVTINLHAGTDTSFSTVLQTQTSDSNGDYSFTNVADGNYQIEFVSTTNSKLKAKPNNGKSGQQSTSTHNAVNKVEAISVSGSNVTDIDAILIDPAGIVYDVITRSPISGAIVKFYYDDNGAKTIVPNTWLDQVAGGNNTQTTSSDGYYSFVLNGNANTAVYSLEVTPPSGYLFSSTNIPPSSGPYVPSLGGGIETIQGQTSAPTSSQTTTYYLSFDFVVGSDLSSTSNGIINNHIPLDQILQTELYDLNTVNQNQMDFGNDESIIGNGKNQGDIVLFNDVVTINGQAIDAVITTVSTSNNLISTYDSSSSPTNNSEFFQPLLGNFSGNKSVTFSIKFYKAGTFSGVGTGDAVTLLNLYVNSYDIDYNQYQSFSDFDSFIITDNNNELQITTNSDGSVTFAETNGDIVDDNDSNWDDYSVQVYYDSIDEFTFTTGGADGGPSYFAVDFSLGALWEPSTITPTVTVSPKLTFGTKTFTENLTDDGAISNSIVVDLENVTTEAFASSIAVGNNVFFEGIPDGLFPLITRNSDTKLTITLTGNASSHVDGDDISNVAILFADNAFSGITSSELTNSRVNDISIDFIESANSAPVALGQSVTTAEETAKTITLSGTDADSDTLSFNSVSTPSNGTLSGTAPNLTYTPAANFTGSDSFTFKVNDGTVDSTTATITINVTNLNDAPVALGQSVTTAEETAKTITLSGTDADSDTLSFNSVSTPSNGTLSGTAPNLTYTPAANFTGSDSFTFKVNDGTVDSTTATITINVTNVNDAPVALGQSVTTAEETAKTITLSGTDADSDTLSFNSVSTPSNGTLSGTAPNLTYTPAANFTGSDSFTFKVNDGTVDSTTTATITINVTNVNDAPVALGQSVTTAEETAKTITLSGTDADSDTLSFNSVSTPSNGTLSGTAPNLTYTPAANFTGSDSFTFKVNDGTVDSTTATITINVTNVNDAPVALGSICNDA